MVHARKNQGYLLVLIMVFGAMFLTMISAFLGYVVTQHRAQILNFNKERALNIAEAGLDYYKWFLAHNPDNVTNGTGLPGPYIGVYSDPEGAAIGEYSLQIASSTACGSVYAIDITSTAHTYAAPTAGRRVYGRYARPTVAEYAYIINSSVWAGSDRVIVGPYHSNGGIRMDGTNNSTVSSGQDTWACTPSFGCNSTTTKDGVFTSTSNANTELFSYPSPPINFTGLTVDLTAMKAKAQTGGGIYIAPSTKEGYHVVFQANGTVKVYRVDTVTTSLGYTTEYKWQTERNVIASETLVGTYAVPTACSVMYVEDKVWLDGVVKGRVTIAAADSSGIDRSMILNDNITYATATSGLLAIAEADILVGLSVPDNMTINGIFAAQKGRFGRNYYCTNDCDPSHSGSEAVPGGLTTYVKRTSLTVNGTIVSNGREGTKWTSNGVWVSGFNNRTNSYDRSLVSNPPPLTPHVSDTYEFIEWREMN